MNIIGMTFRQGLLFILCYCTCDSITNNYIRCKFPVYFLINVQFLSTLVIPMVSEFQCQIIIIHTLLMQAARVNFHLNSIREAQYKK